VIGALVATSGFVRGRRLRFLTPVYFVTGWFASELTLFILAAQVLCALAFLRAGVLESVTGRVGLLLTLLNCAVLLAVHRRAGQAGEVVEAALREGLGVDYRNEIRPARRARLREEVRFSDWARPFHMKRAGVERLRNIPYADGGRRHLLDIYRPLVPPAPNSKGYPILFQIHGGAWMIGEKDHQALPLMIHLAERGWLCVAANYRLSPKVRFPEHLLDAKRALAWIRQHAGEYGGDTQFIAVTGGSAGGHLSALVGLSENRPDLQPGFENVDTSVAACVPFYGVYDFIDRHGARADLPMTDFLTKYVMPGAPDVHPELWELASPIALVDEHAPPFFVLQGTHDSLTLVEETRHFVRVLRERSKKPVLYAELPGAQHAFELCHSLRTEWVINGVSRFLEHRYSAYLDSIGAS